MIAKQTAWWNTTFCACGREINSRLITILHLRESTESKIASQYKSSYIGLGSYEAS